MTRWRSASAATVGRNDALVPPRPWMQTTGSPAPARRMEMPAFFVRTRVEAKPRRIRHAAGGREEPNAQVKVPAHLKPPLAEGLHAPADVARDLRPCVRIRAQQAVGADPPLRGLELGRAVADEDVPCIAARVQADPRRPTGYVDHVRVEPPDQRPDRVMRITARLDVQHRKPLPPMPDPRRLQSSRADRTRHRTARPQEFGTRDQGSVVGAGDEEADQDPHAREPDDADDDARDRDRAAALVASGGVNLLHPRIAEDDREDRADTEEPDDADEHRRDGQAVGLGGLLSPRRAVRGRRGPRRRLQRGDPLVARW